jgi:hypothetical protein
LFCQIGSEWKTGKGSVSSWFELGLYLTEVPGDETTGCQVNGGRGKISSVGEEMEGIGWQLG